METNFSLLLFNSLLWSKGGTYFCTQLYTIIIEVYIVKYTQGVHISLNYIMVAVIHHCMLWLCLYQKRIQVVILKLQASRELEPPVDFECGAHITCLVGSRMVIL